MIVAVHASGMLVLRAFHGRTMLSAKPFRARRLLPAAACTVKLACFVPLVCALLAGCADSNEPLRGSSRASSPPVPGRLEPAPDRKPLLPGDEEERAILAQVAAVAGAEALPGRAGPRIVEISGTPSAIAPGLIHEPIAAASSLPAARAGSSPPQIASGAPASSRYAEVGRAGDLPSHVPPDSVPYLAERPRYDDHLAAAEAAAPAAQPPQSPIVPAPPAEVVPQPAVASRYAEPPLDGLGPAEPHQPHGQAALQSPAQPAWQAPPAESPIAGTEPAPTSDPARAAAEAAAMQAVTERAAAISNRGYNLAQRGMFYAARAELIQALQVVAQACDVQAGSAEHSTALAAGLTAMQEAADFASGAGRGHEVANVAAIAAAHRTPVLKADGVAAISPIVAQQQYLAYAQTQLILAAGGQPVASQALYRLGRVQAALGPLDGQHHTNTLAGPQAMAFQQAALSVDQRNYLAANELGVLLARFGQWPEARRLLLHSVSQHPHAEGWHNLAVVHRQLGEDDLARRAEHERTLVAQGKAAPAPANSVIRWVDTRTFAATSAGDVPWPTAPAGERPQTTVRGSASAGVMR